jgi:hypothetical protein
LLEELTRQISNRLEAMFTELPGADGPSIGVELRERGRTVVIKGRRDRMLFRPPPVPLPKRIESVSDPGGSRFGRGRR